MFNKQEWNKIENAVATAEETTSAEIYPVQMATSSEYFWVGHRLAICGLGLGTFITWLLSYTIHWGEGPWAWLVLGQIVGWLTGWILGQWPVILRLMAGKKRMTTEVDETAHAIFLSHGVHRTKNRNGVLIYISWLEHLVEVLADENAFKKFPKEFWDEAADRMGKALQSRHPEDEISKEIDFLGRALTKEFPATADDSNELPNG
jgi:putative membrane protein